MEPSAFLVVAILVFGQPACMDAIRVIFVMKVAKRRDVGQDVTTIRNALIAKRVIGTLVFARTTHRDAHQAATMSVGILAAVLGKHAVTRD